MRQDRVLQGSVQQVTPTPSPSYNIALPGLGQQDISFLESKMHQDMDISSSMLLSEVPYEDGIQGHVAMDQDPANLVCSVNLDDADTLALRENSTALNLPAGVEQLRDNSLLSLSRMDTSGSQDETVGQNDVADKSDDKNKETSTHVRRQSYEVLSYPFGILITLSSIVKSDASGTKLFFFHFDRFFSLYLLKFPLSEILKKRVDTI